MLPLLSAQRSQHTVGGTVIAEGTFTAQDPQRGFSEHQKPGSLFLADISNPEEQLFILS